MNQDFKHIPLAVGVEVATAPDACAPPLERADSERFGGHLAEDLAAVVNAVTRAHLVTAPALFTPGQLLRPDGPAWAALGRMSRFEHGFAPGITSIGAHRGRLPDAALAPDPETPGSRFLVMPALLICRPEDHDELVTPLERELFERASLRPPALATLAESTGLEPVHGQIMTRADLMALVKVQLAAAGLDPFWPAVEHPLIEPDRDTALELPAGLAAHWQAEQRHWRLTFRPFDGAGDSEHWALWLRALRQTLALLDIHAIGWRVVAEDSRIAIDPEQRWVEQRRPQPAATGRIEHPELGPVGWALKPASGARLLVPLRREATFAPGARIDLPQQPRLDIDDA